MSAIIGGVRYDFGAADEGVLADLIRETGLANIDAAPVGLAGPHGPVLAWRPEDVLPGGHRHELWRHLGVANYGHERLALLHDGGELCLAGQSGYGGWHDWEGRPWVRARYGCTTLAGLVALLLARQAEAAEKRAKAEAAAEARRQAEAAKTRARCRFARLVGRPVREAAGCPGSSHPIVIVEGDAAPVRTGESYYWTWGKDPNGTRVRTNAGRKWRCNYWPSTLAIQVGRGWLAARGLLAEADAAREALAV